MYIRRKVFSLLNVEGEDRYFSTTDYELGENGEVRLFAEKEEKKEKKRVALKDVKSDAGQKRAIAAAILGDAGGGLAGLHYGSKEADKADEEGANDEEILRRAKKKGIKAGAAIGAGVGGGLGLLRGGVGGAVGGAALGAGLGSLGGRNAASVRTKDRLAKRAQKERESK